MKGIYLITNITNGKKYVGCSNNINRRFMEHKSPKNIANKPNILYRAFRKYSIDNFTFQIIEFVNDVKDLPIREKFWINKLNPEYNMNDGGLGNAGLKLNSDTIELLKLSGKLQWMSLSDDEKNSIIVNNLTGPKKGHIVSNETREKLRNANLGKKISDKTKQKISISNQISMIGNKNGNKIVCNYYNGKMINSFFSIIEAANFYNIHPSNITSVLKGRQKTAAGFKWEYGV